MSFKKLALLSIIAPLAGFLLGLGYDWVSSVRYFNGKYALELRVVLALITIALVVVGLQKWIIYNERRKIQKILKSSLRKARPEPIDRTYNL
jgi:hypothetical protein